MIADRITAAAPAADTTGDLLGAGAEVLALLTSGGSMLAKLLQIFDVIATLPEVQDPVATALAAEIAKDRDEGSRAAIKALLTNVANRL